MHHFIYPFDDHINKLTIIKMTIFKLPGGILEVGQLAGQDFYP